MQYRTSEELLSCHMTIATHNTTEHRKRNLSSSGKVLEIYKTPSMLKGKRKQRMVENPPSSYQSLGEVRPFIKRPPLSVGSLSVSLYCAIDAEAEILRVTMYV